MLGDVSIVKEALGKMSRRVMPSNDKTRTCDFKSTDYHQPLDWIWTSTHIHMGVSLYGISCQNIPNHPFNSNKCKSKKPYSKFSRTTIWSRLSSSFKHNRHVLLIFQTLPFSFLPTKTFLTNVLFAFLQRRERGSALKPSHLEKGNRRVHRKYYSPKRKS